MVDFNYAVPVNLEKLDEELKTAFGVKALGATIPGQPNQVIVHVDATITKAQVDAIIAAHNPATKTTKQQQDQADQTTIATFKTNATPLLPDTIAALKAIVRRG